MIIQLKVFEQTLSVVDTNSVPRKGSKDYLVLHFLFSSDWDDLDKMWNANSVLQLESMEFSKLPTIGFMML